MTTKRIRCPQCEGTGKITVHGVCQMKGCENEAVYRYSNEISGAESDLCVEHLRGLRNDVPVEEWVEEGFAWPIKQ